MPAVKQHSFAGGVISDSALGLVDQAKWGVSGKTYLNWLVSRIGTAQNRPGTEYGVEVKTSSKETIIIPFNFNDANTYIVEVGEEYVRFVTDGSPLLSGTGSAWANSTAYTVGDIVNHTGPLYYYCLADHTSVTTTNEPGVIANDIFWHLLTSSGASAILEIPAPWAESELTALIGHAQSADILTVPHKTHPPYELIRVSATKWTLLPVRFAPNATAPTGITNDINKGNYGSPNSNKHPVYKITAREGDTSIESLVGIVSAGAGATGNIAAQGLTSDLSVADTSHGLVTGDEIHITAVATQSASETNQTAVEALLNRAFKVTKTDNNNFTLDGTKGLLSLPAWYPNVWTDADLTITYGLTAWIPTDDATFSGVKQQMPTDNNPTGLQWTAVAGDGVTYDIYRANTPKGNNPPSTAGDYGFLATTDKTVYDDDGSITPDTEQPPPSFPPQFVSGNYPSTTAFFGQRQWYAGSTDNPRRVWGSRVGDFRNFSERLPIEDADKVQFDVAGEQVNEVRFLLDNGTLTVLTRGAALTVTGNSEGQITPVDRNVLRQTTDGSALVRPVVIGASTLYVEARQSVLLDFNYGIANDRFDGFDRTAFASDLFDGFTILCMAYTARPTPILWCVRSDGILLGFTYDRNQNIWAWHKHVTQTSNATVDSVVEWCASIPENGVDTLYVVVKRVINSATVRYIERLQPRKAGNANYDFRVDPWFLDSARGYNGTNLMSDGLTVDATVTMTLTGGTTWAAGETGLTLTATGGTPFPGDTTNVGNGYRILLADGTYAEVEVTTDGSTTVQTVTNLTAIPAGLQGVGTLLWVRMVDDLSGLDHLEGEVVAVCGDGLHVGTATVASGSITTPGGRPYGIMRVGLRIIAYLQTLDFDLSNVLESPADAKKRVVSATVFLEATEGLKVGAINVEDPTTLPAGASSGLRKFERTKADGLTGVVTGKRIARFPSEWNRIGSVWLVQSDATPASVLSIVSDIEVEERDG